MRIPCFGILTRAQDLARKHTMPTPASPSRQGSGWISSYGSRPNPLTRIGLRADERAEETRPYATGDSTSQPIDQVLASPADRFGLVGLVTLMKSQDPNMALLSMGTNLQALGLNLDATESLYPSFVTPWSQEQAFQSLQVEPAYQLPSCYNVQPPPPAQSKIASFTDETLFFIFYSTPRDVLQEMAAQELYGRNWRYHKGLHLWLTKEQNTEPLQKTPTYERGTYVFFDPGTWGKVSKSMYLSRSITNAGFVLMYEMLEEKPPSQSMLATAAVHPAAATAAATAATPTLTGQATKVAMRASASAQPSPTMSYA